MDANLPKVKVAVIGVGHLGQHHARIYSELPGVELVAIADTSEARRREVGARLRVPTVADYRSLIGTVDAVSVAVPTAAHYPIALAFLQAGSDVLVEKPITQTVGEADVLIAAAPRAAGSCRSATANVTTGRSRLCRNVCTIRDSLKCIAWGPFRTAGRTWMSCSIS